jgi:capsular polysaccharide biosynthesis protein
LTHQSVALTPWTRHFAEGSTETDHAETSWAQGPMYSKDDRESPFGSLFDLPRHQLTLAVAKPEEIRTRDAEIQRSRYASPFSIATSMIWAARLQSVGTKETAVIRRADLCAPEVALAYGEAIMGIQHVRSRIGEMLFPVIARAYVKTWDVLGALQPSAPPESSFLLWNSAPEASRRMSRTPLKPYVCSLTRRTLIEPGQGFVIADFGLLVETSVSNSFSMRDPYLRQFFYAPSPVKYFKARILRRYRTDLKELVSLATGWPWNYFHFYRDVLPKILLLEEAGIDPALPVLVPDELFDQPLFQEAIQSTRLSQWNFMSPRGDFIMSERVVFASSNQFVVMHRSTLPEPDLLRRASAGTKFLECPGEVLALLDLDDALPATKIDRRIFLTRSRGRTLSNYDEIEPLLRERNFETVDTEGMTLREQARLFRNCRYLVGLHGAGLVNIIHAHARDLSLLQIRQPGEEHQVTDFALMCHAYGFDHEEIFGTSDPQLPGWKPTGAGNRDGAYRIDPAVLRDAIDRMLSPRATDT